jgi:hypothetical protein
VVENFRRGRDSGEFRADTKRRPDNLTRRIRALFAGEFAGSDLQSFTLIFNFQAKIKEANISTCVEILASHD